MKSQGISGVEIIKLTHSLEACGRGWKISAMNEIDRTLVIRERERAQWLKWQ